MDNPSIFAQLSKHKYPLLCAVLMTMANESLASNVDFICSERREYFRPDGENRLEGSLQSFGFKEIHVNNKVGVANKDNQTVLPPKYDLISKFYNGLSEVTMGNQLGFMDTKGNLVIPSEYSPRSIACRQGVVLVKDNKFGLYNRQGQQLLPIEYDYISFKHYSSNREIEKHQFAYVSKNNRLGIYNAQGQMILPIQFDSIEHRSDDFIEVQVNKSAQAHPYELYDIYGTKVFPDQYDEFKILGEVKSATNKLGTALPTPTDKATVTKRFLIVLEKDKQQALYAVTRTLKATSNLNNDNIKNKSKQQIKSSYKIEVIVPFGKFKEIFALTKNPHGKDVIRVTVEDEVTADKYGLIDSSGKVILKPTYTMLYPFKDGLAQATDDLMDKDGVYSANRKYGYIDMQGKVAIPFKFDETNDFDNGSALVKLNGKSAFINTKGEFIFEPIYDQLYIWKDYATVANDWKWGMVDVNNIKKVIIPLQYEELRPFTKDNPYTIAKLHGKYGIINKKNEVLLPFEYGHIFATDYQLDIKTDTFGVEKNGKWGIVDLQNKVIAPFIYDKFEGFEKGVTFAWLKGEIIKIDRNGNRVK